MLFLGDHAYGAAAQVTEATEQALTVELAVSIAEPHVPGGSNADSSLPNHSTLRMNHESLRSTLDCFNQGPMKDTTRILWLRVDLGYHLLPCLESCQQS